MGEMTQAVPVAQASLREPSLLAAAMSSMARRRSETLYPHFLSRVMTLSLVTPGRMDPPRGAVMI